MLVVVVGGDGGVDGEGCGVFVVVVGGLGLLLLLLLEEVVVFVWVGVGVILMARARLVEHGRGLGAGLSAAASASTPRAVVVIGRVVVRLIVYGVVCNVVREDGVPETGRLTFACPLTVPPVAASVVERVPPLE